MGIKSSLDFYLQRFVDLHDLAIEERRERHRAASSNPLVRAGARTFSQADEDGITLEIMRRIGIGPGTYLEFGVGDGLECNTLVLGASGWRGAWVSGQEIAFDAGLLPADFLSFNRTWVDHDNLLEIFDQARARTGIEAFDLISFDFDGNDLFMVEALLKHGAAPALFIVEYNAKFVPPVRWSTAKQSRFSWSGDDYYGASLQSFADMFARFGYRLVCCNSATGANAFFVHQRHAAAFADIDPNVRELFQPPRYLLMSKHGHKANARTVTQALQIGLAIANGAEYPELAASGEGLGSRPLTMS